MRLAREMGTELRSGIFRMSQSASLRQMGSFLRDACESSNAGTRARRTLGNSLGASRNAVDPLRPKIGSCGDNEMEIEVVKAMKIPVHAEVSCTDGMCGLSSYVLVNPVTEKVTHLVIKGSRSPYMETLVSVGVVDQASDELIQLRCTREELAHMDPFVQSEYIETKRLDMFRSAYANGAYLYWPYFVIPDSTIRMPIEHQQMPPGDLAVRRGARVEATDKTVGNVDEFLVNPNNDNVTHLVIRAGPLWERRDVCIPVSAIREVRDNTVFLRLDKQQVGALPTVAMHRRGS